MVKDSETKNEAEEIMVPGEETAETEDHAPRPWLPEVPKEKRKLPWRIIIPVLVVVFVIGCGAVYALWYQNSDKIVMDALANAISSKTLEGTGTVVTTGDSSSKMTFDGKISYDQGGVLKIKDGVLSDAVLMPDGVAYVRSDNFGSLYNQALNEAKKSTGQNPLALNTVKALDALMGPKISKMNGKWVRISADDLKKFNGAYAETYKCEHDAVFGIGNNATELIQLGLKYNDNKFLKVVRQLPAHDGNAGYEVAIDSVKLKSFLTSLKTTQIFKDINTCAADIGTPIDLDKITIKPQLPTVELWISQLGHQLQEVKVATTGEKGTTTVDVTTTFNVPVKADAPKDFVPLTDVLPSASSLLDAAMSHSGLPVNLTQLGFPTTLPNR